MTELDRRILTDIITVSVTTLAQVFTDHFRGVPAVMRCRACGYRFTDKDTVGDCPTNAVVRPILLRRYHENLAATKVLSADTFDNLRHTKPKPIRANTPARPPKPNDLFDVTPYIRHGGTR